MNEGNQTTKLRVKLGAAEIEYEGGTEFLKDEIMPTVGKILDLVEARADLQRVSSVPQLEAMMVPQESSAEAAAVSPGSVGAAAMNGSLASYLKATGGHSKQVRRFLSTAAWLVRRGHRELTAGLVAKTLQENHQSRLANPADCLNKNVAKGYCEKTKEGFFITPEGWAALEKASGTSE